MIWSAADCGATHAKIQTIYSADLTFRERFEDGVTDNSGVVTSITRPYSPEFARLQKLDLSVDVHSQFIDECNAAGIIPLTTIGLHWISPLLPSLELYIHAISKLFIFFKLLTSN